MQVHTVELADLAALPCPPFGGQPAYLVVTVGGRLLGAGVFAGRASTAELVADVAAAFRAEWRARAVAAAVGRPEAWRPPPRRPDRAATVGICTHDRPLDVLDCCLAALTPQLGKGDEIVVVEGSANHASRAVAERHGARWVAEPRPGSGWVRNRILAEATTDLVAFIDDDCVPDPGWLAALLGQFTDPAVGAVTGPVIADRADLAVPRLMDERYPYHRGWLPLRFAGGTGTDLTPYDSWVVGTGASMAWRRELLDRLQGFDPALGAGTSVGGGEDLDAFTRALALGATIVYEPAATVRHRHARSHRALRRQLWGYGRATGGHVAKAWVEDRRRRPVRALAREWRWELRWAARECLNAVTGRPRFPVSPLVLHPLLAGVGAVRFVRDRDRLRQGWRG